MAVTNLIAAIALLGFAAYLLVRARSLAREEAEVFARGSKWWEDLRTVSNYVGAVFFGGLAIAALIVGVR